MDLFSKLSDYEIFGNLTQGFLLIAGIDFIFGTTIILNSGWDVPTGAAVVLLAYVTGHLIASPSSLLIERGLVRRLVGSPMVHLLSDRQPQRFRALLFPGYFSPLPDVTRELVKSRLKPPPEPTAGGRAEDLFFQIYTASRGEDGTRERIATFLRLYGFCRNSCFVALVMAFLLLTKNLHLVWVENLSVPQERWWMIAGLLAAAWLLLLRYLKFHRAYSVELAIAFAKLATRPPVPTDKPAG